MRRTSTRGADATSRSPFVPGSRGFTLLEMLIVSGMIVLLSALLLRALVRGKNEAKGLLCRGHLKAWGRATHLYAMDHDDFLPPEGHPNPTERSTNSGWYVQLATELGIEPYHTVPWRTNSAVPIPRTVWLCPANARRSNGRNLFHYCLNQHVDGASENDAPTRISNISAPAEIVWIFDSKNLPAVGYWGFTHTNLHARGAQFLFLDGHVSRYRAEFYWDFDRNRARTNDSPLRWIP